MIELRHLHALAVLRETDSMVKTAERVYLTESALSHQIKTLEARIGCQLFHRKTRPLRFTAAGQCLLELAAQVLPQVEAARQTLARLAGGRAGRLHIAIECHSCFDWLMPAISAFRDRWPEVECDLSAAFNFEPYPALLSGDIDLLITSDPKEHGAIHYEALFRHEMVLVVSRSHALAKKKRVAPQDLRKETLITYPVAPERLDLYRHFLSPAAVQPAARRTCELTMMILQLVASGRGVAALPRWTVDETRMTEHLAVLALGQGVWSTVYAAVRSDQCAAAFIQDFWNTARATSFANLRGIVAAEM